MNLNSFLKEIKTKNINDCNQEEIKNILQIRNEEKIRKNMFNSSLISLVSHREWVKKFKNNKKNFFFGIFLKEKLIGGLGLKNYDQQFNHVDWAFYISDKDNKIGLGASVEYFSLEYIFTNFNINSLFCYVLISNSEVLKLHNKFGFKKIDLDKDFNKRYNYDNIQNVQRLILTKESWNFLKKDIKKKYF